MKTIYHATHNSDLTEGKGYQVTDGYFEHAEDARLAVDKYTYMGGSPAGKVVAVEVYESLAEWTEAKANIARQSALAKLTPEEREALGL